MWLLTHVKKYLWRFWRMSPWSQWQWLLCFKIRLHQASAGRAWLSCSQWKSEVSEGLYHWKPLKKIEAASLLGALLFSAAFAVCCQSDEWVILLFQALALLSSNLLLSQVAGKPTCCGGARGLDRPCLCVYMTHTCEGRLRAWPSPLQGSSSTVPLPSSARISSGCPKHNLLLQWKCDTCQANGTETKISLCGTSAVVNRWYNSIVIKPVKNPGFVAYFLWDLGHVSLYLHDLISASVKWGW